MSLQAQHAMLLGTGPTVADAVADGKEKLDHLSDAMLEHYAMPLTVEATSIAHEGAQWVFVITCKANVDLVEAMRSLLVAHRAPA